jgi:hypothetical protein
LSNEAVIRDHSRQNQKYNLALTVLRLDPMLYEIMAEVAVKHGLLVEDILPPTRQPSVNIIMHEFFYRALTETSASTKLVGHASARDHSTVMYGSARFAHVNGLPFPRGGDGIRYFRLRNRNKGEAAYGA